MNDEIPNDEPCGDAGRNEDATTEAESATSGAFPSENADYREWNPDFLPARTTRN